MSDLQSQFVKKIIGDSVLRPKEYGEAFALSNIALCKYWGKRDPELNLPMNSSLSISLGKLGTRTRIQCRGRFVQASCEDVIYLNSQLQSPDTIFAQRISAFLDLFRAAFDGTAFEVRTENNIPTAAGLASSASGFAALVMALDHLAGWGLDRKAWSMLARLGSGSASRSVYRGFVQWNVGEKSDGSDSFAEPLDAEWPAFRIGILKLCDAQKSVGSRDGMNRTVATSVLYNAWPQQAEDDLVAIRQAIVRRDFNVLGARAEQNALSMHATMMSAWPPLIYLQPESVAMIHRVQQLRTEGVPVYLTIDAGPNIKLLFLDEAESSIRAAFPDVQVVEPFAVDHRK